MRRAAAVKTDVDHARPFARGCTDAELARVVLWASDMVADPRGMRPDAVASEQLREAASRLDPGPSAA